MKYQRPSLNQTKEETLASIHKLESATNAEEAYEVLLNWDKKFGTIETNFSLAELYFAQDTKSSFAKLENEHLNKEKPLFKIEENKFLKAILSSPFRKGLEQRIGERAFTNWDLELKSFDASLSTLKSKESDLIMQYQERMAGLRVEIDGEKYSISRLAPLLHATERQKRKIAYSAYSKAFEAHKEQLDWLFNDLVQIRNEMAQLMGRDSYTSLGYDSLGRTDYSASDVKIFREEVKTHLVPICEEIRKKHRHRLGVEDYALHDEGLHSKQGEAKPHGNELWMRQKASEMFKELGPEFQDFYSMMQDKGLMDLESRETKAGGGFCTTFYDHGVPYIFANFNGSNGDVRVFTHECGHAYQCYSSRNQPLRTYLWPTLEACEIHSMSLEFFTYPQMEHFFNEDADNFRRSHLEGALLFIPYGCTVDEFQHWVYANPNASPDDRAEAWLEIESKYCPWRRYENTPYFSSGSHWQRIRHIYAMPFYYIDYCLAQSCALQFWSQAQNDRKDALKRYHHLCTLGGSQSFTDLLRTSGLQNPLENGTLQSIVNDVSLYLNHLE